MPYGVKVVMQYFVENLTKISFRKMIHDTLYGPNPEAQKNV
jgi:hypothetical protein